MEKALATSPHNAEWRNELGLIHELDVAYEDALTHFRQAARDDAHNRTYTLNIARLLRRLGDLEQARTVLEQSLRLGPGHAAAYSELGEVYMALGRRAEALLNHERALQLEPSNVEYLRTTGAALRRNDQVLDAQRHLQRAVELAPSDADVHNELGLTYHVQGLRREALAEFELAVALRPNGAQYHHNAAAVCQELRLTAAAVEKLQQAVELEPMRAEWRFELGALLESTARSGCARRVLRGGVLAPSTPNITIGRRYTACLADPTSPPSTIGGRSRSNPIVTSASPVGRSTCGQETIPRRRGVRPRAGTGARLRRGPPSPRARYRRLGRREHALILLDEAARLPDNVEVYVGSAGTRDDGPTGTGRSGVVRALLLDNSGPTCIGGGRPYLQLGRGEEAEAARTRTRARAGERRGALHARAGLRGGRPTGAGPG
ncbi:MAG: tetratricopeptide repeat protein [Chloroflexia bacterium]